MMESDELYQADMYNGEYLDDFCELENETEVELENEKPAQKKDVESEDY